MTYVCTRLDLLCHICWVNAVTSAAVDNAAVHFSQVSLTLWSPDAVHSEFSIDITYKVEARVDCGSFRIRLLAWFLCKVIEPGGTAWDKIVGLCGLTWSKMVGPGGTTHGKIIGCDQSKWVKRTDLKGLMNLVYIHHFSLLNMMTKLYNHSYLLII